MKKALITGITGQDGSFLAELLLSKGYDVVGFSRKSNQAKNHPLPIIFGDLTNPDDINAAIRQYNPDEIYNLASQSRPSESWSQAAETLAVNGMGAVHLFEAARIYCPHAKIYHASSSDMYGSTTISPQNEQTPFMPTNPYAAAKVYAHQMVKIYRDSYSLFISSGILFNHESERRPLHFLTQKVAYGAACAALNTINSPHLNEKGQPIVYQGKLHLGNLEISRDWGYANDFVQAMWLILQHDQPDDFVIGTGQLHTLQELCKIAYQFVGLNWQDHVISDSALIRHIETGITVADSSKAIKLLGWKPTINFKNMIEKMVQVQLTKLSNLQSRQEVSIIN